MNDLEWLAAAIELSRRCPPSSAAFSVGAIVVDAAGNRIAEGFSRQDAPDDHAEEAALRQLAGELAGATIYSSLEPCRTRLSRPRSCVDLIVAGGIPRVVFALAEPPIFVPGHGAQALRDNGIEVVQLDELAAEVRAVNEHLVGLAPP
jgi:diaminohydroxyphosphoribosylaminopyrimidine deaminase/5-amino-6-(5-phosphoribosylamino)uracil reductase